jgi:hypothetical protein
MDIDCDPIEPIDAVEQKNAFGKYICGITSSMTFENSVRPDSNNNCPSGYSACSENTSADTTICKVNQCDSSGNNCDSCPINDISFTEDSVVDHN